ncbi:conserved hypothetical protein [Gammaproteobacteria bacterium]
MNPLDLLLRVGPAIQAIFGLGYEPTEELFYELTPDQYRQLEKEGKDISIRWFTIIPKNPKLDVPELVIVDVNGVKALLDAARYINHMCEKAKPQQQFASFDDKLKYAATQLPRVFSESSKYAENEKPNLRIVK